MIDIQNWFSNIIVMLLFYVVWQSRKLIVYTVVVQINQYLKSRAVRIGTENKHTSIRGGLRQTRHLHVLLLLIIDDQTFSLLKLTLPLLLSVSSSFAHCSLFSFIWEINRYENLNEISRWRVNFLLYNKNTWNWKRVHFLL